jgi:HD superfamily phosphodiesterase
MKDGNKGNGKLETLRRREQALKAAIAEEKVRQQKLRAKGDARLFSVLGEALAHYAAQSPDFRLMLKQVLQSAELRETDRAFLAGRGWV